MTTSDVLRGAAARVRAGWCQFTYVGRNGQVCAVQAIRRAGGGDSDAVYAAFTAMADAIDSGSPHRCADSMCTICDFNNRSDQTAEGVASMMERVALALDDDVKAGPVARDDMYARAEQPVGV